jgi:hypothetical protein
MNFDIKIHLVIESHDGELQLSGYYDIALPFVPFVGLEIQHRGSHMSKIESVCWDEVDSKFICQTRMREDPFEPGDFEFIACEAVIAGFDVHHKAFHVPTEQMRDLTFKLPNDPDYSDSF